METTGKACFHKEFIWALANMTRERAMITRHSFASGMLYNALRAVCKGTDGLYVITRGGETLQVAKAAGYQINARGCYSVKP